MRALIAFVLLAAVGMIVWWLGTSAEPVLGRTADATPPTTATSVSATPVAAPDPASIPAAVAEGAAAPLREVATELPTGPAANVRVVMVGSNAPVAGAIVRYQPPEFDWQKLSSERLRELQQVQRDGEVFLQQIGRELVTDAEGRCRVPLGKHGTQVVARSGELFAQGYVNGAQDEHRLLLRPDRTLRVRVVDGGGQSVAGIQLIVARQATGKDAASWQWGPTDAEGRFEQAHVQTLAGDDAAGRAKVWALPPGGVSEAVEFDLTAPPPEVVLRLPPSGSVTVRVTDAAGAPIDPTFLVEAQVRMAAFDKRPEDRSQEADGFNRQSWQAEIDGRGVARFSGVVFGRYLVLSCGHHVRGTGCAGPTVANPNVETMLQEAAAGAVLVGTLLGTEGAPFANRQFSIAGRKSGSSSSTEARTGDRGQWRCFLGDYVVGERVVLTLGTSQSERTNRLSIELAPRTVQAGVNDLGEIRLAVLAVVVAGRLICEPGVPVARGQLEIERRVGERWQQDWQLQPEWGDDGGFTVRGGVPAGESLRLLVREGPYLPVEPIECKAGSTGIEVLLRAAGSANAVFLVDERTPVERMHFRFRRTQPPEVRDMRSRMFEDIGRFGQPAQDGRLQRSWTGLTPGTYQLTVLCPGVVEPIVSLDAVAVASGPCTDPRLAGIDLRGRVRTFEVRATDADGQPIVSADAFVVIRCQGDDWYGYNLSRGVVELDTPTALDLYVVAPGHRIAVVDTVSEARTIALERAETTSLRVELPAPLPEGVEFNLRLQPSLGTSRRASISLDTGRGMSLDNFLVQSVRLGADGIATVPVRWPGEHTVEATVSVGGRGGSYIRDFAPKTLMLPAAAGVTLQVGAKGLESALQRVRR